MEYRRLGRTGLGVSAVSLGTEHLLGLPRETVIAVIREAIDRGINYFDVVFSHPEYLDDLGAAFRGHRERVFLTGHLGSTVKDGQYCRAESAKTSEAFFLDVLSRLNTAYVDVLHLHNLNTAREWANASKPGARLERACRLRDEGKARFIGISGHYANVVSGAIDTGQVDVVMFPVNLLGHAVPGRMELQDRCVQRDIGLVAMKPYGGGKLLSYKGTFRVAKYHTGGETFKARMPSGVTPVQCLSYVLAQVGVSTALVGLKAPSEVAAALDILDATETARDFSRLVSAFGRAVEGECVYCNHCLPCPVVIDIAQVSRLVDAAQSGITGSLRLAYGALPTSASACTECGVCVQRCPFGVEVIAKVRQAVEVFER
jgi:hypothetical protein